MENFENSPFLTLDDTLRSVKGKNNKRTRFVLSAILLCMFVLCVYDFDFSLRGR